MQEMMKELLFIKLDDLMPDPQQPRKDFDPVKMQELADSIRAQGVQQAISVRNNPLADQAGQAAYMIIAGERRWRASKMADKEFIPAVLVEGADNPDTLYSWQLTENMHRADLNPVEKAEFLRNHIEYLKGQGVENAGDKLAESLGVSPSWVSKNMAILKYDEEIRSLARYGKLRDYGLLKKVSELKPERRKEALSQIERGDFNSKTFFARKRYEKTKEGSAVAADKEVPKNAAQNTAQPVKVGLLPSEWVRLIEKTDFRFVLDNNDPEWRMASAPIMKTYVSQFKDWVLSE